MKLALNYLSGSFLGERGRHRLRGCLTVALRFHQLSDNSAFKTPFKGHLDEKFNAAESIRPLKPRVNVFYPVINKLYLLFMFDLHYSSGFSSLDIFSIYKEHQSP